MDLYFYCGPVTMFDRCIDTHWHGETRAISEKKAISNLVFQYKQQHGLVPSSRICLPGKLTMLKT